MEQLIIIVLAALAGGLVILTGAGAVNFIRRTKEAPDTAPGVLDILNALEPFAYQAIFSGEKLALWSLTQVDTQIDGADKKAIANALYDLLPEVVMVGATPIPVSLIKKVVSRDAFASLIEDIYRSTDAFLERNKEYLKSQISTYPPLAKAEVPKT